MITSGDEATSGRIETRSVEHRRPRSLFIALGVVAVFAVVLGGWAHVTNQVPHVAIGRTRTPVELDMEPVSLPVATSTPLRPTTSASTELDMTTVSLPVTTAPTPSTTSASRPPRLPPRSSGGCAKGPGFQRAGTSDLPLVSGGERRSYLRTTPSGNEPTPAPLVVVLDDGGGDPSAFLDRAGWNAIAQQRHLVVVAPRWSRARDDAQFATDAIIDAGLTTCVDLARVYVVGFSAGAMLGSRIDCEHPGFVAASVAVAGLLPPDRCLPSIRLPVLAILGERDEVVAPSAILDATNAWAHQDGCGPEPVGETVGWHVEHYEFQRCMDGFDVQLFMLPDMGHEWPERSDDPKNAARWADLMSATTVAITFCESFAR